MLAGLKSMAQVNQKAVDNKQGKTNSMPSVRMTLSQSCITPGHLLTINRLPTAQHFRFTQDPCLKPLMSFLTSDIEGMKAALKLCDSPVKVAAYRLLPFISQLNYVPKFYHNCCCTSVLAFRRQFSLVPQPKIQTIVMFEKWFRDYMLPQLVPVIRKCTFPYNTWYNHLDQKQRNQIENSKIDPDVFQNYNGFVKGELQLEGESSKTREICTPTASKKKAVGQFIYDLEKQFKYHFSWYTSGKSYNAKGAEIAEFASFLGYNTRTIQVDGSAFDSSQHEIIKDIIDSAIYKAAAERIVETHGHRVAK